MDAMQQLVEKEAIGQLKARYCRLIDEKKWSAWEACFTDDAELATFGTTVKGSANIKEMVERSMIGIPSSHQAFLPEIEIRSESAASGIWAAMFIQAESRTTGVGHYFEEYRKVDGRWLISRCELRTAFVEGTSVSSHLTGQD